MQPILLYLQNQVLHLMTHFPLEQKHIQNIAI